MAQYTRYVDVDAAASGTGVTNALTGAACAYVSLNVWEAAEQAAHGATDDDFVICCSNGILHSPDTTAVTIAGWTDKTTASIRITGEVDHGGKWNTEVYRNQGGGSYPTGRITVQETNVYIKQLQVWCDDNEDDAIHDQGAGSGLVIVVEQCIIRGEGAASTTSIGGIAGHANSNTWYLYNNIVYGWLSTAGARGGLYCGSGTMYAYSNTIYDCSYGIQDDGGTLYAENNIIASCTAATNGMTAGNCDYNATDLSSLGYTAQTNDRVSQTFDFVDDTNRDLRITTDDTGAYRYGQPILPVVDDERCYDVLGYFRGTTVSIGAHEPDATSSDRIVKRFVDPDAAASGTGMSNDLTGTHCAYQSLNAWEAAMQDDISTATGDDYISQAVCASNQDAGSGTADSTTTVVAGWTTDATGYIDIRANSSHGGSWNSNIYRMEVVPADWSAGIRFTGDAHFYRVEGIQIKVTVSSGTERRAFASIDISAGGDQRFDKCIAWGVISGTATDSIGIHFYDSSELAVATVSNCIIYGFVNGTIRQTGMYFAGTSINIYNCTIGRCREGIKHTGPSGGTMNVYNTYVGDCTDVEYQEDYTITRTTCAHSSGTSYSGSTASIAYSTANFVNVTVGSEDLKIPASGSALEDAGTPDFASGRGYDILGNFRRYLFSIGAHEPTAVDSDRIVTRFVDPDSAASGNGRSNALSGGSHAYVSLNAWEAAMQDDISSATGDDYISEAVCCSNDASHTADSSYLSFTAWTTDETNYVQVGMEVPHSGVWDDTNFRMRRDESCISISDANIRIVGLQIETNHTGAGTCTCIFLTGTGTTGILLKDLILTFNHTDGTGWERAIYIADSFQVDVINCIIYDFNDGTTSDRGLYITSGSAADTAVVKMYNCTVVDGYQGIVNGNAGGGTLDIYNTYVGGMASDEYSANSTRYNCAHSSATVWAGSTASVAYSTANFVNVTAGSEDLRLISGSALRKVGYADPGNGLYSDGIQGNARPTVYSDDFNRADGVLQSPWLVAGGMSAGDQGTILSNQVTTDGSTSGGYRTDISPDPNMWSEMDVLNAAGGGPAVRQRPDTQRDYYTIYGTGLYRVVNGSNGNIGTLSATPVGKKVRIEVTGVGATVNVKVYLDGILDVDYDDTDATRLTSGEVGLYANTATTGILDNFRGGEMWDIGADQYLAVTSVERTPGAGALVLTGYAAEIAGIDYPITVPTMLRIT